MCPRSRTRRWRPTTATDASESLTLKGPAGAATRTAGRRLAAAVGRATAAAPRSAARRHGALAARPPAAPLAIVRDVVERGVLRHVDERERHLDELRLRLRGDPPPAVGVELVHHFAGHRVLERLALEREAARERRVLDGPERLAVQPRLLARLLRLLDELLRDLESSRSSIFARIRIISGSSSPPLCTVRARAHGAIGGRGAVIGSTSGGSCGADAEAARTAW